MSDLLIHQISKEILEVQKENEQLKEHQKYLQFYSLMIKLAINENKSIDDVMFDLKDKTNYLLIYLSWIQRDKIFIISNRGDILCAKTNEQINTTEQLLKILNNDKH